MGSPKAYGELILDAIDQLRRRKARPDLDRICHMLERRHGLKTSDVHDHLTRLVEDGVVIKVDYKGNTSYRNAAKWVRTKSQYFGNLLNSSDISSVIVEAVETLTSSSTDSSSPRSVPIEEIEKYLLKKDSQSNFNTAALRAVLDKEVISGTIQQLTNGDFFVLKEPDAQSKMQVAGGGKRHSVPMPPEECCEYCLLGTESNRKGVSEELLVCVDCSAKAHPSCVDDPAGSSPWQCPDCKVCVICSYSSDGGPMLFCVCCGKGYHLSCHIPPLKSKPSESWICFRCNCKSEALKPVINSDSCDSNASDKPCNQNVDVIFKKCLDEYPDVIPLADNWSTREVEMFIECLGYENEASAFRDQEIDGRSLLLMKRSDVLTGLDIKLGPALKIYQHISRLQNAQPE